MWLLNARTYKLKSFNSPGDVPYTILSHTWDGDEVLFKDIENLEQARSKAGWKKIEFICKQTIKDGLEWTWVDTCCIDKNSSAELSEAINSMFAWYRAADVCHVHLADAYWCPSDMPYTPFQNKRSRWQYVQLQPGAPHLNGYEHYWECDLSRKSYMFLPPAGSFGTNIPGMWPATYFGENDSRRRQGFSRCRWWRRGWTLQELLAPPNVCFWDQNWAPFGRLIDLLEVVSAITHIEVDVLLKLKPIRDVCVAKRLSWASQRQTTRKEDEAYSLLGILDVNMPILYGESARAFQRLQEEFLKSSTDLSMLAFSNRYGQSLFARSPRAFEIWCAVDVQQNPTDTFRLFQMTNAGLRITLPCVSLCDSVSSSSEMTGHHGDLLADTGFSYIDRQDGERSHLYLPLRRAEYTVEGAAVYRLVPEYMTRKFFEKYHLEPTARKGDTIPLRSSTKFHLVNKQLFIQTETKPVLSAHRTDAAGGLVVLRTETGDSLPIMASLPGDAWVERSAIFVLPSKSPLPKTTWNTIGVSLLKFGHFQVPICTFVCIEESRYTYYWVDVAFLPGYSTEQAYEKCVKSVARVDSDEKRRKWKFTSSDRHEEREHQETFRSSVEGPSTVLHLEYEDDWRQAGSSTVITVKISPLEAWRALREREAVPDSNSMASTGRSAPDKKSDGDSMADNEKSGDPQVVKVAAIKKDVEDTSDNKDVKTTPMHSLPR